MAAIYKRIVKQVLSGDSLILREQPRNGRPEEQTVFLAYVTAPKLVRAREGQGGSDEPLAWEAREFLRKKLIGREVRVKDEYKIASARGEMNFVTLWLDDKPDESLQRQMLRAGLCEINRRKQQQQQQTEAASEQQLLEDEEEAAKAEKIGKWSTSANEVRRLQVVSDLTRETAAQLLSKTVTGIVEHVKDGNSFKVGFFMPLEVPEEQRRIYQIMSVQLSGVKCPTPNEDFYEQARFFSESRLLNRNVQVHIEQIQALNFVTVIGSVLKGEHNIALFLLRDGFAKTLDRTIGSVHGGIEAYRQAEKTSKDARLRIWKNYQPSASVEAAFSNLALGAGGQANGGGNAWSGTVIEIVNTESILVMRPGADEPVKIWFASIRGPKAEQQTSREGQRSRMYDIPYMFEAREFLRRKLIGKTVQVHVDYIQPKTGETLPERICATVMLHDQNIAAALVSKGFATVIKRNDDQKSRDFDNLLQVESKAKEAGKALFSSKPGKAKLLKPIDVSSDTGRASFYLETLSRGSPKEAIVEFVFSSTKFKLYLTKENMLINLVVGNVTVEKTGKFDQNTKLIKQMLQHRDVKCTVERNDKAGNFIGQLYFTDQSTRTDQSFAIYLLKQGYCKARDDKVSAFVDAQREAQLAQRGVWTGWTDEPAAGDTSITASVDDDETATDDVTTLSEKDGFVNVINAKNLEQAVLSFVAPGALQLHVQNFANGVSLGNLMSELREELEKNPPFPGTYRAKVGDTCSARFADDGLWYRARIERLIPVEQKVEVLFIDHGNSETVNIRNDLRPLPSHDRFGLSALPAVAKRVGLAFVYLPKSDTDWAEEVRLTLESRFGDGQVFHLKQQYTNAAGLEMVTLIDSTTGQDLLLEMVKEGYFCVEKRLTGKRRKAVDATLEEYKSAMEKAIKNRLNLWRYGDIRDDDEKGF